MPKLVDDDSSRQISNERYGNDHLTELFDKMDSGTGTVSDLKEIAHIKQHHIAEEMAGKSREEITRKEDNIREKLDQYRRIIAGDPNAINEFCAKREETFSFLIQQNSRNPQNQAIFESKRQNWVKFRQSLSKSS